MSTFLSFLKEFEVIICGRSSCYCLRQSSFLFHFIISVIISNYDSLIVDSK